MSAPQKVAAIITGALDDYTREALRAVVDEAGRGVTLRFDAVAVAQPAPPPPPPPRGPRIADVIAAAAFETGVSAARIRGAGRCQADVRARTAVCWTARELIGANLSVIGRELGNRDHGTIHVACKRAQLLLTRDPAFRLLVGRLTASCRVGQ